MRTSWSSDKRTAKVFSAGPTGKGNSGVLSEKFKKVRVIWNTSWQAQMMGEAEWIVRGVVTGAGTRQLT